MTSNTTDHCHLKSNLTEFRTTLNKKGEESLLVLQGQQRTEIG